MSDLADREAGPRPNRLDYGEPGDRASLALYEADWHLWSAIRRDAELTAAERDAWLAAAVWRLERRRDPSWTTEDRP